MKLIIKILITSVLIMLISKLMVKVEVDSFITAVIVASVLGLLNIFVKPVLIVLSLPATILTLGFFLFVINGVIIMLCAKLVDGFRIHSFLTAMLFSVILSLCQTIAFKVIANDK